MLKSSPPEQLATKIKTKAADFGFCALGITSAHVDSAMTERLTSRPLPPFVPWGPELRCSPRSWLEGAKSVLVGAVSYRNRYSKARTKSDQGYISPFAREPDYHGLVMDKLESLGDYLLELKPGSQYKTQVDSGPGCERLFAVLAGVGWQGKNNFIIVPGQGSFVWLGLLTTDLELPSDQPLPNQCGDCDRCIKACPTAAYIGPHEFNHNLCMAFWAADKGQLTQAQSEMLGKHRIIYGCDYCQLACPHNYPGRGEEGNQDDLPGLEQIMTMTGSEFETLFNKTAAGWRGRNLLRRNAVIASAGNPELKDVLRKLAQGEGMVAEYARAVLNGFAHKDE